jgi:hypothetical protein
MNPPRRPPPTCRTINHIQGEIRAAVASARDWSPSDTPEQLQALLETIARHLSGEAEALEELREANEALRENAIYWQRRAEEAEAQQ